jgi:small subunit ribosomal protein S8
MSRDSLSDALTHVRNACLAKHRLVQIPRTNLVESVVEVLFREGFIKSFTSVENDGKNQLLITLRYCMDTKQQRGPVIRHIERISKPGRRVYAKAKEIIRIRNGFGLVIITTSRGVVTGEEARAHGIGGEVLCYIW